MQFLQNMFHTPFLFLSLYIYFTVHALYIPNMKHIMDDIFGYTEIIYICLVYIIFLLLLFFFEMSLFLFIYKKFNQKILKGSYETYAVELHRTKNVKRGIDHIWVRIRNFVLVNIGQFYIVDKNLIQKIHFVEFIHIIFYFWNLIFRNIPSKLNSEFFLIKIHRYIWCFSHSPYSVFF